MTNKAAREAFEKLHAEWPLDTWLTNPERYADPDTQKRWEGFRIGYQAAEPGLRSRPRGWQMERPHRRRAQGAAGAGMNDA